MECSEKRLSATVFGEKKHFQNLSKDEAVNLKFSDITYRVKEKNKTKTILNGINGEFRAGELACIIGTSGCGKTTLLNMLAGYRIQTSLGQILVNEKIRDSKAFGLISRYVLQEDTISPYFTILETMMFASNFKLDANYTKDQREKVVFEIMDMLRLREKANTLVANVSGGERKRLCIALELIDNPSVILLDEPITGLDESSASQCIKALNQLAKGGRTVICSLHCPSARLLQMFHKVYAMSRGECIYQGPRNHIVPYLEQLNLQCPLTHNPTDFIIEVSINVYGDFQNEMVQQIKNGKILNWHPGVSQLQQNDDMAVCSSSNPNKREIRVSWWLEFQLIFIRFMKQMWRDKTNFKLRMLSYIMCSLGVGLTYSKISDNAVYSVFSFYLSFTMIAMIFFMAMTPMLALIPREIHFIRREYFNHWYRISSYFVALLTSQLPLLCGMSIISSIMVYLLTGQPMQFWRFCMFAAMVILISLVSLSFGILVGSCFNILHSLFLGSMSFGVMAIAAHQSTHGKNLSTLHEVTLYSSFMRYALEGVLVPLLDLNRPDFPCPPSEWMCPASKAKYILMMFGSLNISYTRSVVVLSSLTVIFCLMAFLIIKYRLNFKKASSECKRQTYRES
ncbi:ATP-binding cassette sub-family G member 4 [Stomoxys calcitrans]|uniref:ATP-binding cassette sub-family G member 4 n=1 Tax=Stomoxys calcitrans TaxID=35570 RepID=UPI0027E2C9DD|nr:ATP-binding cassette sub-family G member 4 [Stomoxys calcitrans]